MTKIKIIAREKIRKMTLGEIHDDNGLWTLNGYQEHVFEYIDGENLDELMDSFEELYTAFKGYNCEIRVL